MPLIVEDHLPERDFQGGVCRRPRAEGCTIDTIIIHSCCVDSQILHPALEAQLHEYSEEEARRLVSRWQEAIAELNRAGSSQERETLAAAAQHWEFAAIHTLIAARHGKEALEAYSRPALKVIFEFYGVSAHYLIERSGGIFELVACENIAFHAGKSKMPRPEDGREGVNAFSIGIELVGGPESGFTAAQYESLAALTRHLRRIYPVENVYGHSDIAPGRKTDPEQFDWTRFKHAAGLGVGVHVP